jgi:hypothetical protein
MSHHYKAIAKAQIESLTGLILLLGALTACTGQLPEQTQAKTPSPNPAATPAPRGSSAADEADVQNLPPSPVPTITVAEPITDVAIVTSTPDPASLINRRVQLTALNVQEAIGDRGFWVGNGGSQLFVVLTSKLNQSLDQSTQVQPGQAVDLSGILRPMPSSRQLQKRWQLNPSEIRALETQTFYLQVNKIVVRSE